MSEPWNLRCLCLQNLSRLSSLAFLKIPLFGWSIVPFNRSLCLICLIKTWIILIQFENPIINIFLIVKAFLKIKLFVFSLQSSGRKFELKIRTEKVLNDQFFSLMIFHSQMFFNKFSHHLAELLTNTFSFQFLQPSHKFSHWVTLTFPKIRWNLFFLRCGKCLIA